MPISFSYVHVRFINFYKIGVSKYPNQAIQIFFFWLIVQRQSVLDMPLSNFTRKSLFMLHTAERIEVQNSLYI